MRAEQILRRVLGGLASEVHKARLNGLTAAVLALIGGGELALTQLGRAMAQRCKVKHGIKRADRLLGNTALFAELDVIYAAIAQFVIRSTKRPVILVDWTEAGKDMCALTAAVPVEGRAVAIYSITCPLAKSNSPAVEDELLQKLGSLLPTRCKPILVTDAGFRAPWIRKVHALQWDFVARVRGSSQVQRVGDACWQRWKDLFPMARRSPRCLGSFRVAKSKSYEARLVTVDKRSRQARRSHPRKPRSLRANRAAKGNREPWILATSLLESPAEIVAIYAKRMQIELTFRDLKSHRFGWGFEDGRSRSVARIAIQILLATLASLVTMLVGIAAEQAGLRPSFQANTTRHRRVLSLVALGCLVLRAKRAGPPLRSVPRFLRIVGIP